jgi:hypothetical protein
MSSEPGPKNWNPGSSPQGLETFLGAMCDPPLSYSIPRYIRGVIHGAGPNIRSLYAVGPPAAGYHAAGSLRSSSSPAFTRNGPAEALLVRP